MLGIGNIEPFSVGTLKNPVMENSGEGGVK
jgi:hypothetical protein